jgi:hypothetical protein
MRTDDTNPTQPNRHPRRAALALPGVLLGVVLSAALCGRSGSAQTYVPTADLEHPKIRYADSLLSLNDRCPVRTGKLSTTYKPVYVNGQPIGFC